MTKYTIGEKAIAEILEKYNVEFVFEHPILIKDKYEREDKDKLKIWYPDFWLPEYGIIIEYFGMDTKEYLKGKKHKMDAYKRMKLECIPVYRKTIDKKLRSYLLLSIKKILNARLKHFDIERKEK